MDSRSNASTTETKRQSKSTGKALSNKIELLQKERKTKVNKIEGLVKAIYDLMQNTDIAKNVQFNLHNVSALYDEASYFHDSVIPLLPPEEQERQNIWFSNIQKRKVDFIENANKLVNSRQRSVGNQ